MINLLPPEEKQELHLQQVKKLIVTLGTAIMVIVICLILVLFSVNYYVLGRAISQKAILDQAASQYETAEFLKYKDILQNYNKTIARLNSFYAGETEISPVLENILGIERPKGVYFSNISLSKKADNKLQANISGTSDTRDNLLVFQKNIEEKKSIGNFSFSPESWINSTDINFYLTLEIVENGK